LRGLGYVLARWHTWLLARLSRREFTENDREFIMRCLENLRNWNNYGETDIESGMRTKNIRPYLKSDLKKLDNMMYDEQSILRDNEATTERSEEGTSAQQQVQETVRQLAREQVERNVTLIRNVMLKRGRREIEEYGAGDYVRIKIPRVDRRRLGGKSLVCKVVEVLAGGQYKLGCSSGILDIRYHAADLEAVEAEYPDLLTIPETVVSLTEALRLQNAVGNSNSKCKCKTDCSTRKCSCQRLNKQCGSHCHLTNTDCVND